MQKLMLKTNYALKANPGTAERRTMKTKTKHLIGLALLTGPQVTRTEHSPCLVMSILG